MFTLCCPSDRRTLSRLLNPSVSPRCDSLCNSARPSLCPGCTWDHNPDVSEGQSLVPPLHSTSYLCALELCLPLLFLERDYYLCCFVAWSCTHMIFLRLIMQVCLPSSSCLYEYMDIIVFVILSIDIQLPHFSNSMNTATGIGPGPDLCSGSARASLCTSSLD